MHQLNFLNIQCFFCENYLKNYIFRNLSALFLLNLYLSTRGFSFTLLSLITFSIILQKAKFQQKGDYVPRKKVEIDKLILLKQKQEKEK